MKSLLIYALVQMLMNIEGKLIILLTDGPIEKIGPRIYKKEVLTKEYKYPKELAYDSATRNLYFMYMDDSLQNSGRAYINVITKESKKINGISRNKATAVDSDTGDVYFGSDDGLYKYDPITNTARNIGLYNVNVFRIVIRNNQMYIIDANNHMMYVVNQGRTVTRFGNAQTVFTFDVDTNNNVHFVTMCGLYCAVGGREVVKNRDMSTADILIVDDDKAYAVADQGIHEIDCANGTASKLAELNIRPRSMVFGDYGDIFFAEDDVMYRLKPLTSYLIYNFPKKGRAKVV